MRKPHQMRGNESCAANRESPHETKRSWLSERDKQQDDERKRQDWGERRKIHMRMWKDTQGYRKEFIVLQSGAAYQPLSLYNEINFNSNLAKASAKKIKHHQCSSEFRVWKLPVFFGFALYESFCCLGYLLNSDICTRSSTHDAFCV